MTTMMTTPPVSAFAATPWRRTIPTSYWLAAGVSSVLVFVLLVTSYWPGFRGWPFEYTTYGNPMYVVYYLMKVGVGVVLASTPFVALRWPLPAMFVALLPVAGMAMGLNWPFAMVAALAAVALCATWRAPAAAWFVTAVAACFVGYWLVTSGEYMHGPFASDISIDGWEVGRRVVLWLIYAIALSLVTGLGMLMRSNALSAARTRELESKSAAVDEQGTVLAERARLARDLHDVVAHHVSLIAVRAETAPYSEPEMTEASKGVLRDIADDARSALDELRQVLGILRRADEDQAERAPLPGVEDILGLVERSRRAGDDVTFTGGPVSVGGTTGYAAYRVVQEALTNARKHAAGQPVTVRVLPSGGGVRVEVSNPLVGTDVGPERGLAGMRERVDGLGGRFLAGPHGDRFVVDVLLPGGGA